MSIKKVLFTTALVSVATLGLASCSGDDANKIEFYTSMGDEPRKLLDPMVEAFNAKQSTYKISVVNPGGGYDGVKDAVNAAIQGNKQPAIAYCYPDHVAEYLPTGKVVNMYDLIHGENGFTEDEIADFIPQFYEEGYKAFGKTEEDHVMYTLPFSKSTEAMYYNVDVMKALYGDAWKEHLPKTWDDLWEIGKKLKSMPEYKDWFVLGYDSESNWFITMAEQLGNPYTVAGDSLEPKDHIVFNDPSNVKMMEGLKKIYDEKLFTTQKLYGSYTSNLFTKAKEPMKVDGVVQKDENGNPIMVTVKQSCLFSIGSTAGATHQKPKDGQFVPGVTSIPQVDTKNPKSISQGPSLCMLKQSDPEKEKVAWEFVKELLAPEFQAKFAQAQGYMPVRVSCTEDKAFKEWLNNPTDLIAQTMKLAIDQRANYFISPAFNGSNKARTQVGAALISVLKGTEKNAAKALQDAYDEAIF